MGLLQTVNTRTTSVFERTFMIPAELKLKIKDLPEHLDFSIYKSLGPMSEFPLEIVRKKNPWKVRPGKMIDDLFRSAWEKTLYKRGRTPTAPVMMATGIAASYPFWPWLDKLYEWGDEIILDNYLEATKENLDLAIQKDYKYQHLKLLENKEEKGIKLLLAYDTYYKFLKFTALGSF